MSNLNVPTVELVSTLRAAPLNGAASSQDYNDSWTESLADLASLAGFINDVLIPMLNGLSSSIQPTLTATPSGIEGRFIFSDTTDTSQVFFDNLSDTPNTIADSLRVLEGIVNAVQTTVGNLNIEVTALQTALSSTNQNDIAQALQNFAAALESLTAQVNANTAAIAAISLTLLTNSVPNGTQNILNLTAGANVSLIAGAGGVVTIAATNPTFKINGTLASSQSVLNLIHGTNVIITDGGSGNITISSTGGSGSVILQTNGIANSTQILLNLASGLGMTVSEAAGTVTIGLNQPPFDVPAFVPGLGSTNQKLVRIPIARNVLFPAGAANSYATASAVAAASTTFTISCAGTPFCTVNFALGSSTGVFTQAADQAFAPGDLFEIDGPATPDATLADVGITLWGYRTS